MAKGTPKKAPESTVTADEATNEGDPTQLAPGADQGGDVPHTPPGGNPLEHVGANMPPPQEHAIAAQAAKDAAEGVATDTGTPSGFDPSIHVTGKDGKPVMTSKGAFRIKPGGAGAAHARKLAGLRPTPVAGAPIQEDPAKAAKALAAQVDAAAKSATQMVYMGGAFMFGPEAATFIKMKVATGQEIDEEAGMTEAWRTYFQAKGITDIPPGLMVTIICCSYAAARFQMPAAKPRLAQWRTWFYVIYAKYKAWRENRKYEAEREHDPEPPLAGPGSPHPDNLNET